jgi:hypothetical protein
MKYKIRALVLFAVALAISVLPLEGQTNKLPVSGSSTFFAYVADAISSQLSGFSVAGDGTLSPVPGSPYTLPAEFPVTVTPTSLAYIPPYLVVGGANPNTSTGISVFKVDATTGALTIVPNGPPLNTFIDYQLIAADPQNHVVYAIGENNNAKQQAGLSSFRLAKSGRLTQIGPTIYPGSPSSGALAVDPLGRYLYVCYRRERRVCLQNQQRRNAWKAGAGIALLGRSRDEIRVLRPEWMCVRQR